MNHLSITPSMECAQLTTQIDWMYDHFNRLMTALPQAMAGDVSTESSSYLELIGYSTEAEKGPTLVQRIWQGIKTLFGKIKEFLGRLLSARKHHLKGNEFKIEKLKKYIQNIDMDRKPEGKMSAHTALLSADPASVISSLHKFTDQTKQVMAFRTHGLEILNHVDVGTLDSVKAKDIHSKFIAKEEVVRAVDGGGSTSFLRDADKISYESHLGTNRESTESDVPSVILMNSIVAEYEKMVKDDAHYVQQIEKESTSGKDLLAKFEKLMSSNSFQGRSSNWTTVEEYDEINRKADAAFAQGRMLFTLMTQVQRLTHNYVWDVLYSDLEDVLQKALGQYKFKKHELHEEDRHGDVDAGERRYREEQARDRERHKNDGDHEYR
jgi:hypothetical protein